MLSPLALCCLLAAAGLLLAPAWATPAPVASVSESLPLSLVSELGSRLGARPARLPDARLPLPSPQELDAIKKVAQILVMLGQQVIPAIIGEPTAAPGGCEPPPDEVPSDPVNLDKQT